MRRDRSFRPASTARSALPLVGGVIVVCALLTLFQLGAITERRASSGALRQADAASAELPPSSTPAPVIPEPPLQLAPDSSGVVVTVRDANVALAVSLLRELRCLGNTELIEFYHCFDELSTEHREMLRATDPNARVIDVCASLVERQLLSRERAERFRGEWLAPLALHETSLEQVVLSDASNLFLQNPSDLRDTKMYKETGTLFFHERVVREAAHLNQQLPQRHSSDRERFLPWLLESFDSSRFGLPPYSPSATVKQSWSFRNLASMEQDASLVVIDKRRARVAMSVLWFAITELRFNVDVPRGPQELYWLAFELGQQPYSFSPWGASSLSLGGDKDVTKYEATLCGSLGQFLPTNDATPELLFLHGRALVDPVPSSGVQPYNMLPTHMTPRLPRSAAVPRNGEQYGAECSVGLGKTEAPPALRHHLWRRRQHFMAASLGLLQSLRSCDMGGPVSDFQSH
ncbi:hypothetical protein PINS_up006133 [Pythium insidiosum]|nr:hypothetical protein PINS_up006133 [Pythium insidiosum]